jgi:DegV family protein with EDD domain
MFKDFFMRWLSMACAKMKRYCQEIDRTNVFPVPDGDTGRNMKGTLMAVRAIIARLPDSATLNQCIEAVLNAAEEAEGNSGSFLSAWLRGFCLNLPANLNELTVGNATVMLSAAFEAGYTSAFSSTRKPLQGTILDPMSAVSLAASDPRVSFDQLVDIAWMAVDDTPKYMPKLAKNGVVDSGAMGFALAIIEAMYKALTDNQDSRSRYARIRYFQPIAEINPHSHDEDSKYQFCCNVRLSVKKQLDLQKVEDRLWEKGDCVVLTPVGVDGKRYKLHVHVNKPDDLRKLLKRLGFKITRFEKPHDMWKQVTERNQALLKANLENDRVAIITDSASDLGEQECHEFALDVLPISVALDGRTTAVSEQTWVRAAEARLQNGKDVILVTLSSGLSSTYDNAERAAAYLMLKYPERRVDCVDSLAGSRAQAWLCIKARKMLRASHSHAAVVEYLLEVRHRIHIYIAIGDVDAMVKGGRMPKIAYKVLSGLNLVPIVSLTSDGKLAFAGLAPRKFVISVLSQQLRSVCHPRRKSIPIAALYTDGEDNAEVMATVMSQALRQDVPVLPVGPVIGAHLGADETTVAFVVIGKPKK